MSPEEFEQACKHGNLDLVKKIASNNTYSWNWGIYCAAKGGHINIIKFFIEKASENNGYIYWDWGLYGAVISGNLNIINFFIEKASENNGFSIDNWNDSIKCAAEGGHYNIISFFIDKGADINKLQQFQLEQYNEYLTNKEYIRSLDYNKDLLEEIVAYY